MDSTNKIFEQFRTPEVAEVRANAAYALPVDGLPERFVQFCRHVAECRNVPAEVVILSALTIVGAACGGLVKISLGGYQNNASLQTLIIAPSGSGKTAPLRDLIEPLQKIDAQLIAEYRANFEQWTAQNAKNATPSPKPERTQILPRAETEAALRSFCVDNPRGGLYFGDEIRTFFKCLGTKYNLNGCARAIELFNGDGLKIDVNGEELRATKESFIGVLGGLQTALLPKTITVEHVDSGLMARFVPVFFDVPENIIEARQPDAQPMKFWNNLILNVRSFGNIKWTFEPTDETSRAYTDELQLFNAGFTTDVTADAEYNDYFRGCYRKCLVVVHRLILCATVLKNVLQGDSYPQRHIAIDAETIEWAFRCVPFLMRERMKLYEAVMGRTQKKLMSDAELVRCIAESMKRKGHALNQTKLGEALCIDRSNISRYLRV